ncbi:hypothetical protein C8Q72DRAFT_630576 [Fomitopsis betulina]|nr:hypothetical protein C8Q72DRAFT_630576 [Fomitopsis betulina]
MFARKLPAVESLCIYDATWQVGPNQSSVFVHLESFTSITELRLLRTTFPTKLVLAQLICALPRLTTLACTVVDFRSPVWNSAAFIAVPPRVKDLRLDGPSDDVAELFATQLGIAASMEAFTMGWAYTAQDVPSEAAILSMLRRTGPILRSANIRLRRPSGTSPSVHLKKPGDQVHSASKDIVHESLTLSPCIELLQLHLGYCLQIDGTSVSKPGSVAMTGPQAPATPWLYNLIASITSRQLRYISIQLDVRRIKYKGPFQLLRLAQDFLSEQRFQQIDQLLSSHERFKNLRWVRIDLLCSPATHSPGQDTWKDAIRARFSLLHARKLLVCDVKVRVE